MQEKSAPNSHLAQHYLLLFDCDFNGL